MRGSFQRDSFWTRFNGIATHISGGKTMMAFRSILRTDVAFYLKTPDAALPKTVQLPDFLQRRCSVLICQRFDRARLPRNKPSTVDSMREKMGKIFDQRPKLNPASRPVETDAVGTSYSTNCDRTAIPDPTHFCQHPDRIFTETLQSRSGDCEWTVRKNELPLR